MWNFLSGSFAGITDQDRRCSTDRITGTNLFLFFLSQELLKQLTDLDKTWHERSEFLRWQEY
jgi:hypothetical protein